MARWTRNWQRLWSFSADTAHNDWPTCLLSDMREWHFCCYGRNRFVNARIAWSSCCSTSNRSCRNLLLLLLLLLLLPGWCTGVPQSSWLVSSWVLRQFHRVTRIRSPAQAPAETKSSTAIKNFTKELPRILRLLWFFLILLYYLHVICF